MLTKSQVLALGKFPNSSRATFKFEDKSEYERKNIDKTKIKYARLYWGGAVYDEWQKDKGLLNAMYENIFGYTSVKFKTPDGLVHLVKAKEEDVKWDSSFTPYNPNAVTRDTYYKYCKDPNNPDDTGGCDAKYTIPLHPDKDGNAAKSTVGIRSGMYFTYQASADVTDLVKASLGKSDAGRTFAVGGIASTIKKTTPRSYKVTIDAQEQEAKVAHGTALYADGDWSISYVVSQYGGWSLVIVYDFGEEDEGKIKPKAVNIYSGMSDISPLVKRKKTTSTQTTQNTKLNLTFDDFYTPTAGTVNSSLAFMGFGGRKEITGEDVMIKKNDGTFQSLTSGTNPSDPNSVGNPSHNQFNSSITRFGYLANVDKKFNSQMDLDLFDISNFMSNKQSRVDMQFEATASNISGNTQGDRLNIGMVAFSTALYDPEVCYTEELQIWDSVANKWVDVAVKGDNNPNKIRKVKTGTELKTLVTIQNKGHEDANNAFLKINFDPKFISYKPSSSCLQINTSGPSDSQYGNCQVLQDSGDRVQIIGNTLKYVIGKNASTGVGGTLTHDSGNFARLKFVGVLNFRI
ncbi:hypothetical protein VBZ67_09930 [Campylobacter concisus]